MWKNQLHWEKIHLNFWYIDFLLDEYMDICGGSTQIVANLCIKSDYALEVPSKDRQVLTKICKSKL